MSPRRNSAAGGRPAGTGPGGSITPQDIRAKLNELAGDVEGQVQAQLPVAKYAAIGGAVALLVVVFLLGRRSGRRKSTIVEIRRG